MNSSAICRPCRDSGGSGTVAAWCPARWTPPKARTAGPPATAAVAGRWSASSSPMACPPGEQGMVRRRALADVVAPPGDQSGAARIPVLRATFSATGTSNTTPHPHRAQRHHPTSAPSPLAPLRRGTGRGRTRRRAGVRHPAGGRRGPTLPGDTDGFGGPMVPRCVRRWPARWSIRSDTDPIRHREEDRPDTRPAGSSMRAHGKGHKRSEFDGPPRPAPGPRSRHRGRCRLAHGRARHPGSRRWCGGNCTLSVGS